MTVGSVVNAITILRHLARSPAQGVNAIARSTALSPSTCFNILKTLTAEDFASFDPVTKAYSLGSEPSRLFQAHSGIGQWNAWLREELDAIANRFEICCGLWELSNDRATLVEVVDSPLSTRIHLSMGQRLPAQIGAMGRCIAAYKGSSTPQLRKVIEELRWQAPPRLQDYAADVERARDNGWAVDDGNYLSGVTTVAAAIPRPNADPRYCITCTMFSGQFDASAIEAIGRRVAQLARSASDRLYGPHSDNAQAAAGRLASASTTSGSHRE